MSNMHLVTGYAGTPHVTAADQGSMYAAIFGSGAFVLERGSKFAASTISNNIIRIADGDILLQGRHGRIEEGVTVNLSIENGTAGYYRNDLIVARYTRDANTGVESVELTVLKGAPVTADPVDPVYITGDIINDHALQADMPLYRVPIDGINVQTLVPLFTVMTAIPAQAAAAVSLAKAAASASEAAQEKADASMPQSGGTFTGDVAAYGTNRKTGGLRNIEVRATSATGELQSTNKIIMVRK